MIWHEYGHAIQDDQVPDFGSTHQGGAIGEAFGDYMAVTMSQAYATGHREGALGLRDGLGRRRRTRPSDAALPASDRRATSSYPEDMVTATCTRTARSGRARCGT